jgi:glutathione synthase/RimK-type ligase-like ATP-grasp enzyme
MAGWRRAESGFGKAYAEQDDSMSRTLIVVDKLEDWAPFYPSEQVVSFRTYLDGDFDSAGRIQIINLCKSYRYLADGYYCSLLAEARGHHVIPSVQVLNDLGRRALYRLQLDELAQALERSLAGHERDRQLRVISYFGTTPEPAYRDLVRKLFDLLPCPVLEIVLRYRQTWEVAALKAVSPRALDDDAQSTFAEALDRFSRQVWRSTRKRKRYRYDMAVLVNPDEDLPPSNSGALKRFIRAGRELGIDVELIKKRDYPRLTEFDALFIRETTAIDHHSYRFARKAESEGLVVVDDPVSILRCTNKVYLADLFRTRKVPSPRTRILHKGSSGLVEQLESEFGYPLVLKIPDGSFSRGVIKVHDRVEMKASLKELFRSSALLLAQEFFYTDFDWRIGIFNNRPLYACRYYMVKNHWQIYRHGGLRTASGNFDTLPVSEVPPDVMRAALAATRPIGNSLYGVDVKEKDGKGYIIEVNDNPNIDRGIEDRHMGEELYRLIMGEFLRRMEERGVDAGAVHRGHAAQPTQKLMSLSRNSCHDM